MPIVVKLLLFQARKREANHLAGGSGLGCDCIREFQARKREANHLAGTSIQGRTATFQVSSPQAGGQPFSRLATLYAPPPVGKFQARKREANHLAQDKAWHHSRTHFSFKPASGRPTI